MNNLRINTPFISIVIPTYNRPERLSDCLESLTKLEYPRDCFEVVVVDDGSKISLESVVEPFKHQLEITLLKQENAGPATARNTGAKQAKGEFLAFTDDDCKPAQDWLKTLADKFVNAPDCLIGGKTINILADNPFSTASQELINYLYSYYNKNPQKATFFASNNIAVSTKLFDNIGGFDTTYPRAAAEDRELCDRWLQYGKKMVYAPEVEVYHAHKLTLSSYWKQHFFYGRGAFCFHQVRAKRAHREIKVEPISFYLNLLKYPLSQPTPQPKLLLSALLFISQVAGVTGFFWERTRQTSN
ncbi:putative glycosyltransferase [Rivularia sp. PCC 7116]|uniref:glycosyltransferase n=1 Tax=Rivularia sp. PCC 7116 TaxID=373994 RepID=UPI00029F0A11|nr:glycosyltransferase [Rivularia sp. PCC 7116]AFY59212.1 putative glycosyltransferase [Rivularia sp. PCC 7116]